MVCCEAFLRGYYTKLRNCCSQIKSDSTVVILSFLTASLQKIISFRMCQINTTYLFQPFLRMASPDNVLLSLLPPCLYIYLSLQFSKCGHFSYECVCFNINFLTSCQNRVLYRLSLSLTKELNKILGGVRYTLIFANKVKILDVQYRIERNNNEKKMMKKEIYICRQSFILSILVPKNWEIL